MGSSDINKLFVNSVSGSTIAVPQVFSICKETHNGCNLKDEIDLLVSLHFDN